MEEFLTYLTIMLSSSIKFVFGPTLGAARSMDYILTSLFTALGMMLGVIAATFFGEQLKKLIYSKLYKQKPKVFTTRNRRIVKIWSNFGVPGVAFFTPIILTPIGGTLLAVAFGGKRYEIFISMAIAAIVWAFIITYFVFFAASFAGLD
uniref:hypothetical protein n=1 Tax=Fulvivirga sp. TaxID=1931237 RepID=UPI00404A5928